MLDQETLPPIPIFNIKKVLTLRDKLLDDVFYPDLGLEFSGDLLNDTAERVRKLLKLGPEKHPVVLDSLRSLAGRALDLKSTRDLCWRLAGNLDLLHSGRPVLPWSRQAELEWVPAQVHSSRFFIRRFQDQSKGELGHVFRFRILAGTSAALLCDKFWSPRMSSFASKKLGFTRPQLKLFKRDDLEFTSFRLLLLIEPDFSGRAPGFRHFYCPDSLVDHNKSLIKMRRRIGFACPFDYEHECYLCPHGIETCGAATHPYEYEVKRCSGCGEDAYFDTDESYNNHYCIHCEPRLDSGLSVAHQSAVSQRGG
jgi:hypothetical protein